MLTQNDCEQIAKFIMQKSECHFILVMYDNEGNRQQFGYGCEKCAADILFTVATDLAQKPHNETDDDQPIH